MNRSVSSVLRNAARVRAQERLLDLLLPSMRPYRSPDDQAAAEQQASRTRQRMREQILLGRLDERTVELEVTVPGTEHQSEDVASSLLELSRTQPQILPNEGFLWSFRDYCVREAVLRRHVRSERIKVAEALRRFEDEALKELLALQGVEEESFEVDREFAKVLVVQDALLELLRSDPALIYSISHRRFEEVLWELLGRLGFKAELTARTRDGGCDIVAFSADSLGIVTKYVVEAKHYSAGHKVGVGLVRQLNTVRLREQAHHGILVTSSYFTKDAVRENQAFYGLHLHDFDRLTHWLKGTP